MSPEVRRRVAGVRFMMFRRGEHPAPHLHVEYAEHAASIAIRSSAILTGSLPPNKLRLAREWIAAHSEELLGMWDRRLDPDGIYTIEG